MRIVGARPLDERLLAFRTRGQIELERVSRTGLSDGSQAPKTPKENVLPIDLRGLGTAAFVWLTPRQVVRLTERIQPSSYLMVAELVTELTRVSRTLQNGIILPEEVSNGKASDLQ